MTIDPRLAVLLIVAVVAAILLLGNAHLTGTPRPTDCGSRNPAGQLRGCPDASEGD